MLPCVFWCTCVQILFYSQCYWWDQLEQELVHFKTWRAVTIFSSHMKNHRLGNIYFCYFDDVIHYHPCFYVSSENSCLIAFLETKNYPVVNIYKLISFAYTFKHLEFIEHLSKWSESFWKFWETQEGCFFIYFFHNTFCSILLLVLFSDPRFDCQPCL